MSGRAIVPPHHIVALMKERAFGMTRAPGITRDLVARALIEAWVEGVNAGFSVDDSMLEVAEAVGYTTKSRVVKECGCGIKYDAHAWKCLAFAGYQEDDVEKLEMRNCACGSTLAIEVPR